MTGKERREQLLGIGRRLFAERGFEGTSIEEIAAQAGVSKPVVYEHFGGKEGLYAVVVDREVERLLAMVTGLLDGGHTRAKFEAAAVALLRYINDNADGPHPGQGLQPRLGHGHLRYAAERHCRPGRVHPGRFPRLPRARPQARAALRPDAGGHGRVHRQWWLDARKPELEEVAANLIDLAWNGLSQLDANGRGRRGAKGIEGAEGAEGISPVLTPGPRQPPA